MIKQLSNRQTQRSQIILNNNIHDSSNDASWSPVKLALRSTSLRIIMNTFDKTDGDLYLNKIYFQVSNKAFLFE